MRSLSYVAVAGLALLLFPTVQAAIPPSPCSYQAVLRDNGGNPLTGSYDMIFRFFDAASGGNEIFVDEHLLAGSGAVNVTGGLFATQLGAGNVHDGSASLPNDPYMSMDQLFRDFTTVWMQAEVRQAGAPNAPEPLTPRVQVLATPYALSSHHSVDAVSAQSLQGRPAADFIDNSAAPQVKAGNLTVGGNLTAGSPIYSQIMLGTGGALVSGSAITTVTAGDADDDDMELTAGNGNDGKIALMGAGEIMLQAGNGNVVFADTAGAEKARLDASGTLQLGGQLNLTSPAETQIGMGDGALLYRDSTGLLVRGGNTDDDDLWLRAGTSTSGNIAILGNERIDFRAGNGDFRFRNAASGQEIAAIDPSGNLRIDGNLTTGGTASGQLLMGTGASMFSNDSRLSLIAGDSDLDSLDLYSGDGLDDGHISITGGSAIQIQAGDGNVSFQDPSGTEKAHLDPAGGLQLAGDLTLTSPTAAQIGLGAGSLVYRDSTGLLVRGGNTTDADLWLRAGTSTSGNIAILGSERIDFRAGNGDFRFRNGASGEEIAALDPAGNLQIDGSLRMGSLYPAEFLVDSGGVFRFIRSGTEVANISNVGIVTEQAIQAGYNGANGSAAFLAEPNIGVIALGFDYAGHFSDGDQSGEAHIGFGDRGIWARGLFAGGTFSHPDGVTYWSDVSQCTGGPPCTTYKIRGTGAVSFVQNHPLDPDAVIVYSAPEGDETAVYTRGSARLAGGKAQVRLGETFQWVANPDIGLTVQLTPHGDSAGLYVESVTPEELIVRESAGGKSDVAFDYIVHGLRIGFERAQVIQRKDREALLPGPEMGAEFYETAFDPASLVSLDRYRGMTAAVAGASPATVDLGRAAALRQAILESGWQQRGRVDPVDATSEIAALAARGGQTIGPGEGHPHPEVQRAPPGSISPGPGHGEAPDLGPAFPPHSFLTTVGESVEAGDLLANDPDQPGTLRIAREASDPGVIGIVAGEPGTVYSSRAPIALAGSIVSCKVDASYAPIGPNDLLVASPTPGHAMRAATLREGTLIGKALEPLDSGTGIIRILVMMR